MRQLDTARQEQRRKTWNGIAAAVIAAAVLVGLVIVKPAAPDRIVLLTGPVGSTYHHLGTRYADELRRHGLKVDVEATAGALDNLQRLAGGEEAVGFAPSTADRWQDSGIDTSDLVALASVGLEPLWVFHRSDIEIDDVPDLAGRTLATGGSGTVSHHLAHKLIEVNGLEGAVEYHSFTDQPPAVLVDDILSGFVDAVFVTGDPNAPIVEALLSTEGVGFASFDRARTYATINPGLMDLVAPEGIFDLARNLPSEDAHLLSATSCLVAHRDLHPAVVPIVIKAVESASEEQSEFVTDIAFPSSENLTLPLDPAARRYFNQGETGLAKYLPYQVTRYLNHLGFFVLPLLTLVVVVLKIVPTVLRVWFGIRLKRLIIRLGEVEKGHAAGTDRAELLAELDNIDRSSATIFVPRSAAHDYIDLRQFLHDMRERVTG